MFEEPHRQVGVLVFLHVEVNELGTFHAVLVNVGVVDSGLIEFRHAVNEFGETFLVVQSMGLGIDTRNLYGDIIDVGFLECLKVHVVAFVCLTVAQHHFAKQIDVLSDFLLETCGKVVGEMRTCGIDNHSAGVAAQTPLHDRNGNLTEGRHVTERFVNLEEEMVERIEEFGNAILVNQFLHSHGQFLVVANL